MKLLSKIPITYLLLGMVILLIGAISLYEFNSKSENNPQNLAPSVNLNERSNKQEKEEGSVTVVIEYLPQKSDKNTVAFNVALDTHSVDLTSFYFSKGIVLEKDGLMNDPIKFTPSGSIHHRQAELIFERVESPFSIIINDLSDIPKREFQFTNIK